MKKIFLLASTLILSIGIFSFSPKTTADTLAVDVTKSKITWNGSAADHYHTGSLNIKSGQVIVDNGKITGGKFTLDLTTIKSNTGGDALDNHLKSASFFDVAKSAEATYEITGVNYTSDNTADITGNFLVKGATVPVKLTAKIRGLKDGKLFTEATFSLDPSALGFKVAGIDVAVHLFAAK
jgi:polyisoprenoid-binding protein YceI